MELDDLETLCVWMRKHGVRRARAGNVELEFERTPALAAVKPYVERPKTEDELARERRALKRRRYEAELGARVDDRTLDRLP